MQLMETLKQSKGGEPISEHCRERKMGGTILDGVKQEMAKICAVP